VFNEVTIVVESYTHGEGAGLDRVAQSLRAATDMVEAHGAGEVLVADTGADADLADLLAREFPDARRVDASGLGYDQAKVRCAREARGRFVLYLDGDCIPAAGWLDAHLAALRGGRGATGGLTRYDGGFLGAVGSILDFGFLLPAEPRVLGCYAFNNAGFERELFLAEPPPNGPMRCRCYAHAQRLLRRRDGVWMVPEAKVRHERQPFFRERYRQGFDAVAACWTDPELRAARFLKLGLLGAPLFYADAIRNDWRRLVNGRLTLELASWQVPIAAALMPIFRLVDLAGAARALAPGGPESGVGMEASA
jgi:glycosyltransferase involved in cell wall biosynthesis